MCSYGLSVFLCDSLSFGIPKPTQVMICLAFCLYYSIMGISKRFFFGGAALGIGVIALWFLSAKDIMRRFMTLYYAGVSIYNAWFRRLDELGYNGMLRNVLDFDYSLRKLYLTEEECRMIAYGVIMMLLCALSAACIMRRARIIPILFVGASLCTLMMYFGLCRDNTGFAIMVASLCGIAALAYYDGVYASKKQLKKELGTIPRSRDSRRELKYTMRANSALGGFCGIASALIALILLWIPTGIKDGMRDIPSISHPMLRLENFVVAMVNGDRPDVNSLIFSGISDIDSRSTSTENRSYRGTKLFEVRSHINSPIYLRNWTGIDYRDDSWHTASYEKIAEYRDIFGEDFSPDLLTFELLAAVDPSLCTLPTQRSAVSHTEFGYITTLVHVKKLMPSANLLFMPSYTDQRLRLLKYGTRESEETNYSNYFDGIYTGTSYLFLDEYSTLSNVPLLTNHDFAGNIGLLVQYYSDQYAVIAFLREAVEDGESDNVIKQMYEDRFKQNSVTLRTASNEYTFPKEEDSLVWRYVYEMSDEERKSIHALADNLTLYYNYVYQNYLSGSEGFDRFGELAASILLDEGLDAYSTRTYNGRHQAVMAVIDYLSENMLYTLTPKEPSESREYINAAEAFLFDTNEGYCVQYATSAVMLLRSLGIPARYAEGYITGDYAELPRGEQIGSYTSTIIDGNAHAWIEVYYDYYGWVQYEATAPFYANMYEATDNRRPIERPDPSPTDTEYYDTGSLDDLEDLPTDGDSAINSKAIAITVSGVFLAAAIAITVILLRRRADQAAKARQALISSACSRTLDPDARIAACRALDDKILRLLAYKKMVPEPGEHPHEFAARVDEMFGKFASSEFTRVSDAMLVGEFGTTISQSQLELIAGYYADLSDYVLRSAKLYEKPWLKYFYLV